VVPFRTRRELLEVTRRLSSSLALAALAAASWRCSGASPPAGGGIAENGGTGGPAGTGGVAQGGDGGTGGTTEPVGQGGSAVVIVMTSGGAAGMSTTKPPPVCGDAHVDAETKEECDDGEATSGDGCSERCTLEAGWSCPFPGVRCEAAM